MPCHIGTAQARLDERIARSPVGEGWIARMHFADACASQWIGGELVHLEDLVLQDAPRGVRTPSRELSIIRIDTARPSGADHAFHERWAAQRILQ